jgi:hypothetical protein
MYPGAKLCRQNDLPIQSLVGTEGGQPPQDYAIKSMTNLIMLEPMLELVFLSVVILNPGAKLSEALGPRPTFLILA